jgi:hypothetical protein
MISSSVVQMMGTTGETWNNEALEIIIGGIWTSGS